MNWRVCVLAVVVGLGGCAMFQPEPVPTPAPLVPREPEPETIVQALEPETPPPVMIPVDPRLALSRYVATVQRLIRSQMQFKGAAKGNPEVLIEVKLKKTLRLAGVRVVKSSGNNAFDDAVKRAVQKAGRYPVLPAGVEFAQIQTHKIRYRLHETV
ncbi:TonB C-terminal domain-containing protein [Burkholderiaceae bacterium DAT-1]|nr:TonB C-terminal domain-containing protein [Burkholderiaceae bacterium DAT-1]